jgi:hypothetical protein
LCLRGDNGNLEYFLFIHGLILSKVVLAFDRSGLILLEVSFLLLE